MNSNLCVVIVGDNSYPMYVSFNMKTARNDS